MKKLISNYGVVIDKGETTEGVDLTFKERGYFFDKGLSKETVEYLKSDLEGLLPSIDTVKTLFSLEREYSYVEKLTSTFIEYLFYGNAELALREEYKLALKDAKVIKVLSTEEEIFNYLTEKFIYADSAINSELMEEEVVPYVDFSKVEFEKIKNKEFKTFILEKVIVEKDERFVGIKSITVADMIRFMEYLLFGSTELFKMNHEKQRIEQREDSDVSIKDKLVIVSTILATHIDEFAKSFETYKKWFMKVKVRVNLCAEAEREESLFSIADRIRKLINKISKESKVVKKFKYEIDFGINRLFGAFCEEHKKFIDELSFVSALTLLGALYKNSKEYLEISGGRKFYKIRNGKVAWKEATVKEELMIDFYDKVSYLTYSLFSKEGIKEYEEKLMNYNPLWKMPLVISDKWLRGGIYAGSVLEVEPNYRIGIHWENGSDFDLHFEYKNGKIQDWINNKIKDKEDISKYEMDYCKSIMNYNRLAYYGIRDRVHEISGINHSGDCTSGPADELISFKEGSTRGLSGILFFHHYNGRERNYFIHIMNDDKTLFLSDEITSRSEWASENIGYFKNNKFILEASPSSLFSHSDDLSKKDLCEIITSIPCMTVDKTQFSILKAFYDAGKSYEEVKAILDYKLTFVEMI